MKTLPKNDLEKRERRTQGNSIQKILQIFLAGLLLFLPTLAGAQESLDLSDIPLDIKVDNTPPNILFVIDDSGSMDWEFMTDLHDGKFHDPDDKEITYLYNAPDNFYAQTDVDSGQVLGDPDSKYPHTRADYRATWNTFNRIYFNPAMTYTPWPLADGTGRMDPADPDNPKYHPTVWNESEANAFPLDGLYHEFYAPGLILIDDGDDGYDESKKNEWKDSASDRPYGGDSRYTTTDGESATWTHEFTSDESGTYIVQGWWSCYNNRDEKAQFTITHADGVEVIPDVDQRFGSGICGQWTTIGSSTGYDFDSEAEGIVEVKRTEESTGTSTVADAIRFLPPNHPTIEVINAHYYAESNAGDLYLVNLKDPVEYYQVDSDHGDVLIFSDFTEVTNPPSEIEVSAYGDARQNFANWFTYYRKRYLISIAAIAEVISDMSSVYVGLAGINATRSSVDEGIGIIEPVLPLGIDNEDYRQELLTALYNYDQITGYAQTPMRDAMMEVWQYFNRNPDDNDSNRGQGSQDKWRCSLLSAAYPEFYPSGEECEPISGTKGSCQQNFVVLFTDGYYNGGAPGIQNVDGTRIETADGTVLSGIPPFADNQPNTLADVVMNTYAYDLAPDIDDKVPTHFPDYAPHQHTVTHVITFGVNGNIDPTDYPESALYSNYPEDTCDTCPDWPQINEDKEKIDDMFHASVNGRGVFKSAANPEELIAAFQKVVESILDRVGVGASAAVNSQELQQGSQLYLSGYNTEGWAGYVRAFELNHETAAIRATASWDAGDQLETLVGADGSGHGDRIIFTYDSGNEATIPFRYGSLTTARQGILTEDQVNYIRGDKRNEQQNGGSLRNRITRWETNPDQSVPYTLGDIVHSSPFFYEDVVFVGANDGMLHGFLADGSENAGKEIFAYVPNLVFDNLDDLTRPDYQHLYFVNNTPFIRDIGGTDLLVGGLGKGGRGYFGLDVTDAAGKFDDENDTDRNGFVQWEFNAADAADGSDMGYSYGSAYISKSHRQNDPWVVIFGNGYGSDDGDAVLFILDADDGTVVQKIETGSGDADPDTSAKGVNGLSTPAPADINGDGVVDHVYAGDLQGNLWKFDITASNPDDWDVSFSGSGSKMPLFRAMDADGNPQPITSRPDVTDHCSEHGYMVVFGTGKYLGESDIGDEQQQTIYGIWDYGDDGKVISGSYDEGDDTEYLGTFSRNGDTLSNLAYSTLLEQTSQAVEVSDSGITFRVLTAKELQWVTVEDQNSDGDLPDPSNTEANHAGWYYDLPDSRERVVQDIRIRSGRAVVVTNVPAKSGGLCLKGSAVSYLMEIDPCSGGRTDIQSFDVDNDGAIDNDDFLTIDNPDYDSDQPEGPGNMETIEVPPTGKKYDDHLYSPTYVISGGQEYKITTATGGLNPAEPGADLPIGMIYWQQHME